MGVATARPSASVWQRPKARPPPESGGLAQSTATADPEFDGLIRAGREIRGSTPELPTTDHTDYHGCRKQRGRGLILAGRTIRELIKLAERYSSQAFLPQIQKTHRFFSLVLRQSAASLNLWEYLLLSGPFLCQFIPLSKSNLPQTPPRTRRRWVT